MSNNVACIALEDFIALFVRILLYDHLTNGLHLGNFFPSTSF